VAFNYNNYVLFDNFEVWSAPVFNPHHPPAEIRGDANGDGVLNVFDVTVSMKYIAEWQNITIDSGLADMNGNGRVGLGDITLMLKRIAKWNVTL